MVSIAEIIDHELTENLSQQKLRSSLLKNLGNRIVGRSSIPAIDSQNSSKETRVTIDEDISLWIFHAPRFFEQTRELQQDGELNSDPAYPFICLTTEKDRYGKDIVCLFEITNEERLVLGEFRSVVLDVDEQITDTYLSAITTSEKKAANIRNNMVIIYENLIKRLQTIDSIGFFSSKKLPERQLRLVTAVAYSLLSSLESEQGSAETTPVKAFSSEEISALRSVGLTPFSSQESQIEKMETLYENIEKLSESPDSLKKHPRAIKKLVASFFLAYAGIEPPDFNSKIQGKNNPKTRTENLLFSLLRFVDFIREDMIAHIPQDTTIAYALSYIANHRRPKNPETQEDMLLADEYPLIHEYTHRWLEHAQRSHDALAMC